MTQSESGNSREALLARLDGLPVTRLHIFILVACALGFSFDLAEIAFGNILSAVFSAPPHPLDGTQLSWLLAAVYVGAVVGAPLLGLLADRFGRRTIMLSALLILTVTSVAASLSPNIPMLTLFRGLSGIALGAYPPLMIAFMTDILPPSRRGPLVMFAVAIGYLGPPGIFFLVRWLTPLMPLGLEGWRWAFLIAGLGAAICALLFWFVPESPRWLISRGRLDDADLSLKRFMASPAVASAGQVIVRAPVTTSTVVMDRFEHLRRLVYLIVIYFLTPWASVGFTVLAGAVLVQKGINVQDSILYVGISTFAPVVGTFLAGFFIDRLQRRTALVMLAAAMGLFGLAFGASTLPVGLMASGILFNLGVTLFTPVLVLYGSELFTTDRRAGAISWAWASSRVGSALVPLALLPLLQHQGPVAMFVVISGTLVAFIALVLLVGPRGEAGRAVS